MFGGVWCFESRSSSSFVDYCWLWVNGIYQSILVVSNMMVMGQWVLGRPPEGSTTATGDMRNGLQARCLLFGGLSNWAWAQGLGFVSRFDPCFI